jgi:hypothetical protein
VVNGEMSLRRLKLSICEVVMPREEEDITDCVKFLSGGNQQPVL